MDSQYYGKLSIIGMRGCEGFVDRVNQYLHQFRVNEDAENFIVTADCPRFGTGEAKGMLHDSMRGHDVYIISDCFNYGETYTMYGQKVPMSPDDHFADLKRVIGAIGGKARRISVIMPMLYECRQHKRSARESLDCAMSLQELVNMGVTNIITFDAHDARVQNAIPLSGFDSVRTSYQMIKALVKKERDIDLLDAYRDESLQKQRCARFYDLNDTYYRSNTYFRRDNSQDTFKAKRRYRGSHYRDPHENIDHHFKSLRIHRYGYPLRLKKDLGNRQKVR